MNPTPFRHLVNRALALAALATLAWTPAPALAQSATSASDDEPPRSVGEVVNVFNDSELKAGRRADIAVTIFGNAQIDGEVEDVCVTVFGNSRVFGRVGAECVTVFGDLDLDSEVEGDLVVVMGQAHLGPNAVVHGETIVVGGQLVTAPGATLHGQKIQVLGFLPAVGDWFRYGFLLGRPITPGLGWVWFIVGLHLVLYLLVAALLPGPVERCEHALGLQALTAFGAGLLGLILCAPLGFVLIASGVGLIILPFVMIAFLAALIIGKAAVFQWIGRSICRRLNTAGTCPPLVGFLVGFAVVTFLYMIPLLGFLFYGLLIPLAFGAAILAVTDVIRASRAARTPAPAPAPFTPGPAPLSAPLSTTPTPAPQTSAPVDPVAPDPAAPSASPPADTALPAAAALGFSMPVGASVSTPATPAATPAPSIPLTGPAPTGISSADFVSLPRAGFWIRTAAAALDLILVGWLLSLLFDLSPPAFLFFWIAYHVGLWTWRATTIGGIMCGLKVVRLDGRPVDFPVALVRAFSAVFSGLALFVGFFWAGWTSDKLSWHDKIAGTTIVKVPRGVSLV